ncbi:hypothetical protein GQ53DRAFT_753928 [Thozetella sp. PMI_491]|nr:hypothetical protein GQ53DRAFT_753928 [Thozetella sp. PMI_491]
MTNHKTTLYDHYGAPPHSYVFILLCQSLALAYAASTALPTNWILRSWYWFRAVATRLRNVWW